MSLSTRWLPTKPRVVGDDDSLPPAADPDQNTARARPCAAEAGKPGSREECVGRLGWAHAGESGLDDEEGGVDEDADEDEQRTRASFFETSMANVVRQQRRGGDITK